MKEKQQTYHSIWNRLIDGLYTRKDVEGLLHDKEANSSSAFDEASARLWKAGGELASSIEEWGIPL